MPLHRICSGKCANRPRRNSGRSGQLASHAGLSLKFTAQGCTDVVHSQRKGASGEREFSKAVEQLTGVSLERRLDQCRGGGHDLDVISGAEGAVADWLRSHAIEVKRYRQVTPALIAGWWRLRHTLLIYARCWHTELIGRSGSLSLHSMSGCQVQTRRIR